MFIYLWGVLFGPFAARIDGIPSTAIIIKNNAKREKSMSILMKRKYLVQGSQTWIKGEQRKSWIHPLNMIEDYKQITIAGRIQESFYTRSVYTAANEFLYTKPSNWLICIFWWIFVKWIWHKWKISIIHVVYVFGGAEWCHWTLNAIEISNENRT